MEINKKGWTERQQAGIKFWFSTAVLVLCLCLFNACWLPLTTAPVAVAAPKSDLPPAAEFEGGKLYYAGKFRIVELSGDYRQMGRQYGGLLSKEIHGMVAAVETQYEKHGIVNPQASLADFSSRLFGLYPRRFKELAYGMAETARIDLEKLAILNEFFDYILLASSNSTLSGRCAAISVWGGYTGDGSLLMGRNFDFPAFFREFDPYITVVVYNPADAVHAAAVITYPGQIGSIQGFNNRGIVLENNDGSSSGDPNRYFGHRIPNGISDLEILLDHGTLHEVEAALLTRRLQYPLLFQLADSHQAYCYEMSTDRVVKRPGESPGLLISVNHFTSPEWVGAIPGKIDLPDRIADSQERQRNLSALAESRKGGITANVMMKMLDIPVAQGGATPEDRSIYQFVFIPRQGVLWLKARSFSDWTEIDLSKRFRTYQGNGYLQ